MSASRTALVMASVLSARTDSAAPRIFVSTPAEIAMSAISSAVSVMVMASSQTVGILANSPNAKGFRTLTTNTPITPNASRLLAHTRPLMLKRFWE